MHAVDNYLFAKVNPECVNSQDPPPYLVSSATQPRFSPGKTSGPGAGMTTTSLPFYFHVEDKLFTMMIYLYSTQPEFPGMASLGL